jgi:glycosyltransferase involved in cell wall biosynthesis
VKANTTKKRILVFIDWYLPGYKAGGPVRSMANMTAHLSDEIDFYIVTRNTEYGDNTPYKDIEPDRWTDHANGVKVWYCSSGKPSLGLWKKLIKETSPDWLYINGIYSPLFSILPLLAAKLAGFWNIIVAPRGMLAPSAINVKQGKKKLFLRGAKILSLYKTVRWHVTNEKEGEQVKMQFGKNSGILVANNLPRKLTGKFEPIQKERGSLRLCIPARIAPEKNTLFALECLLQLSREVELQVDLYGQIYNQEYWNECLQVIESLPKNLKVSYCGIADAEEIPELLKKYHGVFLPSRGENFGHVILESFMAGRPVIISDQTPWRNLEEKHAGWDLSLDNNAAFAATISRLAAFEQKEYDRLCMAAWELGEDNSDNSALLENYITMFS